MGLLRCSLDMPLCLKPPLLVGVVDLEVVVGDVVEHAGGVADAHLVDRAVDRRHDLVLAAAQHVEGAVGVLERELGPEEVAPPVLPGALLGAGVEDALDGQQPHDGVAVVGGLGAPGRVPDDGLDAEGVVDGQQHRRPHVLARDRALVDLLQGVDRDLHALPLGSGRGVGLVAHLLEVRDRVVELLFQLVEVAQRLHGPVPHLAVFAVALGEGEVDPAVLAPRLVQIHRLTWPFLVPVDVSFYHMFPKPLTSINKKSS